MALPQPRNTTCAEMDAREYPRVRVLQGGLRKAVVLADCARIRHTRGHAESNEVSAEEPCHHFGRRRPDRRMARRPLWNCRIDQERVPLQVANRVQVAVDVAIANGGDGSPK